VAGPDGMMQGQFWRVPCCRTYGAGIGSASGKRDRNGESRRHVAHEYSRETVHRTAGDAYRFGFSRCDEYSSRNRSIMLKHMPSQPTRIRRVPVVRLPRRPRVFILSKQINETIA
jgi:hypothetical protein